LSSSIYFGNSAIQQQAYDFKALDDAVALRSHILDMFERATHAADVIGNEHTDHALIELLLQRLPYYGLHPLSPYDRPRLREALRGRWQARPQERRRLLQRLQVTMRHLTSDRYDALSNGRCRPRTMYVLNSGQGADDARQPTRYTR